MKIVRCECSRCKLYLRAAAEPSDQQYESAILLKAVKFEARKYQTSLLEYAKRHNIMACLPTGSGKTFIALKLLEFFKDNILTHGKKGIFLANTIPLVNQQAAFIARNSSFRVRHLTGDMEVDYWTQEVWKEVLDAFDVMMMTSQIFLNLIKHGFIRFSQVALLIFDECHHAIKDHPMCHIMKEYIRAKDTDVNYSLPRILGMTATIINGSCKPHEVRAKVRELEGTMQSVALTYADYEEVLKHSTSAVVSPIRVEDSSASFYYDAYLVEEMESLSAELGVFRKEREKAKMKALKLTPQCVDPKLRTFDNVYNLQAKKVSPGDLKVALDDVIHSYKELGLSCTLIAINLRLAFINFSLLDVNDGAVKGWYFRVKGYLEQLKEKFQRILATRPNKKDQVLDFNSPKLNSLIKILESYREAEEQTGICEFGSDDNGRLCGLIFTSRRTIAQVLAWYLRDLAQYSKTAHGFLRPDFVVGTSQKAFESVESRVYARKQTATLNKFREKSLNLLTATSVLEEGIDVPSCNLVVRFDLVTTYTSYVQSMGRARKKGAKFYALVPSAKYAEGVARLRNFKEINEEIISYLKANVEKVDAGDVALEDVLQRDPLPPICPGGTADSPKITMDSAADVVDRYCMLLPCDGISSLQSLSWWEEDEDGSVFGNKSFRAVVKMPLNSLVTEKIVGKPMRSKELAKQAAYLAAAERLCEAGVLDENLLPVHQTYPLEVSKYFESLFPTLTVETEGDEEVVENVDKPEQGPATKKTKEEFGIKRIHREWYSKRVPKLLSSVFLEPGKPCYAYRLTFFLKETSETNLWNNLFSLENSMVGFALISAQKLSSVGNFPLYGSFGTLQCSLKPLNNLRGLPIQNDLHLDQIANFQSFLFSRILGIQSDFLERNAGNRVPFLIAAIQKAEVGGQWELNTEEAEREFRQMEAIQKTGKPKRSYDAAPFIDDIEKRFPPGTIVFPWYKRPNKPAYLVECISSKTALSSPHDAFHATYEAFVESQFGLQLSQPGGRLLQCKLAGVAVGRCEKDPIQLNYLLQKYAKEDEEPVLLAPELSYIAGPPGRLLVQLKLLPSFLHRLSRLLLAKELAEECCSELVGWARGGRDGKESDFTELSKAQEFQKGIEEERRQKRLALRNATLKMKAKGIRPPPPKVNMEQRELHYEFIHPNEITGEDIKLFHEAVSSHHSAKKLTLDKDAVEVIPSELSPKSKFELLDIEELNLEPIVKKNEETSNDAGGGPSLLSIMEALSLECSGEGATGGKLSRLGSSFLTFAVSLFAFSHWPEWGEPLLCQLRNRLLSLQMMNHFGKRKGLGEWLAGSDFNPGLSWIPPGKHVVGNLGELAARHGIHLNAFEPLLVKNKKLPVQEELERFAAEESKKVELAAAESSKTAESVAVYGNSNAAIPAVAAASTGAKGKQQRAAFALKHASFSHCQLNDADISTGLTGLVGAFLQDGGPAAAYKALEWLQFKAPDSNGKARTLDDLEPLLRKGGGVADTNSDVGVLLTQLESVERTIQYTFRDKGLLLQSFTHPTYPAHNLTQCYQRLEFLGDAVLDFLLTRHIYSLSPSAAGGNQKDFTPRELEDICSALINPVTYASLAVRYGLHKHLLSMSKSLTDMIDNFVVHQESVEHHVVGHFTLISDEECWGAKHIEVPKVLSDLFEALAGAVYVDSGGDLDVVWGVFFRLTQYEIDWFSEKREKGPMHSLQVLAQNENFELKFQRTTGKKTQARGREIVRVNVGPYGHYFGVGTSRRRAKAAAAKIALKLIKEEDLFIQNRDATKIMLLC